MTSNLREEPVHAAQKPSAARRRPGAENVPPGAAKSPKKTSPGKSGKENDQAWLAKRKLADKEVYSNTAAAPFVRVGQPQDRTSRAATMETLVEAIRSNSGRQLMALGELRKALGAVLNPPMQEAMDAGAPSLLAAILGTPREAGAAQLAVQLEAAWCLTQLASGDSMQTSQLVKAGAVDAALDVLVSGRVSESHELCERCLMLLANVAGDADSTFLEDLLKQGLVAILGNLFEEMQTTFAWSAPAREEVLRALTWLMSSLCRGRSAELEELDCAFDYFSQVLQGTDDVQMLSSALWGLCHLLESSNQDGIACSRAARMLSAGFEPGKVPRPPATHPLLKKVVECMRKAGDSRSPLATAGLRLAGVLVSLSDPFFTDALIAAKTVNESFLEALHSNLVDTHADGQVQRDAAWVLANIAAGSPEQATHVAATTGLVEALCGACERSPNSQVRSECMWAITNLVKHGKEMLLRIGSRRLLQMSSLTLRREQDPALQRAMLDAVEAAMLQGAAVAEAPDLIQQLQELAQNPESSMYRKARHLLHREKVDENEEAQDGVNSPRRRDKYKYGC